MSKKVNPTKRHSERKEVRIYGINAIMAVFENRPEDIIQLFLTKERLKTMTALTKYCAQNKKAYHLVETAELDQMTKATHHEGACILMRAPKNLALEKFLSEKKSPSLVLALEGVSNPHNVGAMMRTAAHFGVHGLLLNDIKLAQTAAAIRTAEGGAEYLELFETKDLKKSLQEMKKNGYQILTTSSHAKVDLFEFKLKDKVVVVFGEEALGLSKEVQSLGELISIPGTDHVESLNVSVASAVVMAEFFKRIVLK